jgi:hypothetical protein
MRGDIDLDLLLRLNAEDSLAEFVRQAWPLIEPTTPLLWNWHLDAICEHLEAVAAGDLTRLIVNVPPRSGKSLLTSVFFPVWVSLTQLLPAPSTPTWYVRHGRRKLTKNGRTTARLTAWAESKRLHALLCSSQRRSHLIFREQCSWLMAARLVRVRIWSKSIGAAKLTPGKA